MDDQEVLDFLEHFGVKGMRWGVQKDKNTSSDSVKSPSRVKAFAKGAAIGAGVAIVGVIIANVGARKISSLLNDTSINVKAAQDFINNERKVKIDAIIKTHREGHIDKSQMENFVAAIQKRYDRKIAEAIKDL